jgi:hypothetical protein
MLSSPNPQISSSTHLALPISALSLFSLFSLFAPKCTKLTPLFSYSSTLFKKECLPKPFAIKLFHTLSQNTRGCTRSFPSPFDFILPALSGVEGSTACPEPSRRVDRLSVNPFLDALDAASSLSLLFATLTKNTGGWGSTSFKRKVSERPWKLLGDFMSMDGRLTPTLEPRSNETS